MRVSLNRILSLVAIAGVVGVCSSKAALQAHFHLPVAAHWGLAVLAPGDYQLRITEEASGRNKFILEGAGNTCYATPLTSDQGALSGHSSLELVEVAGTYFVHEYKSGVSGRTFTFGVPRQAEAHHSKTVEIAN